MALTGGYLVLTKDQERLLVNIDKSERIRFNGNFSGVKNKFTF